MSEEQADYNTDAAPTPYRTPWTVHSVEREDGALTVCTGDGGPAFGVAYVPNENHEITEKQQRLHARLIAAAPTMHERLLRLNTMLSWYLRPDVERAPEEDEIEEMLQWTQDALEKATPDQ